VRLDLHARSGRDEFGHTDGRPRWIRLDDELITYANEIGEVLLETHVVGGHLDDIRP